MSRRPPHLRHATLALALVACQRPAQPEQAAPAPLPAPPVELPDVAKKLDLPANATTPEPARPEPARPEPISGPFAATAIERGALVVSTQHDPDDNKTDIYIKILDERGSEAGAPRRIRRTTGEIVDIAIHHHDGSAWIAWQSRISNDPRTLVAAIRVAADLSSVAAPVTLNQYSHHEDGSDRPKVRVLARPGGAAVVAASGGSFNNCTDIVSGRRTRCPGFDLLQIGPDGVFSRAAYFGADGGDPGLGALVDVGSGALVDVWAWHGGPSVATIYAPHGQPAADPPFPLLKKACRPPSSAASPAPSSSPSALMIMPPRASAASSTASPSTTAPATASTSCAWRTAARSPPHAAPP